MVDRGGEDRAVTGRDPASGVKASRPASSNHAAIWDGRHVGRSWTGHPLEDGCPCEKAPCGLAIWGSNPDCPQHGMGAWKTIRQSHRPEDCPDAIPNSAAEYRGGAGITEGVGATGDAPAPEPRCDACGGPDGRVSAKYTDDGSDIYLCEACDGRGWIVQGANCTACSGTGHATRNRVFATDEERMEYVCASHIGETSGRTTPNSTDTLGDVQDAVFLWSCESLTAEQAMEMILRALHA